MWRDPIVEETRERREQYAASLNHDVDAIFADIRLRQADRANQLVKLPPRKPGHSSDAA
jgi:hypothetical protein